MGWLLKEIRSAALGIRWTLEMWDDGSLILDWQLGMLLRIKLPEPAFGGFGSLYPGRLISLIHLTRPGQWLRGL